LALDKPLQLNLLPFEESRFPAYSTVISAAREGGSALAAINAADEVLAYRFIDGEVRFTEIASGLQAILERWRNEKRHESGDRAPELTRILEVDRWARDVARDLAFDSCA